MGERKKIISLFSGAGGLDIGLEAAGFDVAIGVEKDSECIQTLRHNRPKWQLSQSGDISKLSAISLLQQAKMLKGEAALIVGGPPCQPFSKSGYWVTGDSKRLKDKRAMPIGHFFRIVEGCLPEGILLENVMGIGYRDKDEGLKLIESELCKINLVNGTNYVPVIHTVNAAAYGVPQTRERLFVIAHREGKRLQLPDVTHAPEKHSTVRDGTCMPYTTAWDAIGDLDSLKLDASLEISGKWAGLIPAIPEGQNYLWHTNRGGGAPIFGWRTRYWSFLLKLQKSRPSWTLQASPGPATGPFHWRNRRLSTREMCRIQTFPDSYKVIGNHQSATRQIGNAVPPAIGELFGKCIMDQFLDSPTNTVLSLIPKRREDQPRPHRQKPILERYLKLVSDYPDHPGQGKGPRAQSLAREF